MPILIMKPDYEVVVAFLISPGPVAGKAEAFSPDLSEKAIRPDWTQDEIAHSLGNILAANEACCVHRLNPASFFG